VTGVLAGAGVAGVGVPEAGAGVAGVGAPEAGAEFPVPAGVGAPLPGAPEAGGAGAAGVRWAGFTFLCLGASGNTNGPFWPQPASIPAMQTKTHSFVIFITSS
jgi:hypothetical protein